MSLPQPFFNSREARTHLARQRLFECGERPTGLVSEAVIQSWMRCLRQRQDPARPIEFEPVTVGRVQSVLRRNRPLLDVAAAELRELDAALAGTSAVAVLLDTQGVVMHTSQPPARTAAPVLHAACRVGVDLSEPAVGTTAPGLVLQGGEAVQVAGAEHFAHAVHPVHCAAAPVRDPHGRVVAVLDLSVEGRAFGFDAGWLAERYARGIEYRLLLAMAHRQLVVHLQFDAALLDGPWSGLVGVDPGGRVAWLNAAASAMLGLQGARGACVGLEVEAVLGLDRAQLERRGDEPTPQRLVLPSGLGLWSRCRRAGERPSFEAPRSVGRTVPSTGPGGAVDPAAAEAEAGGVAPGDERTAAAGPASNPPPDPRSPLDTTAPTLRDADQRLVVQTVQACGGNVSLAARRLGVSRGLVYRHLRAAGTPADPG